MYNKLYKHSSTIPLSLDSKSLGFLESVAQILGSVCLMSLSAQIAIPLWFSAVPLTLQTTILPLIAWQLGRKKAAIALLLYITQGMLGLPCFALGGSGLAYILFGPTGGYLAAMPIMAYFIGKHSDANKKKVSSSALGTLFLVNMLCLFMGASRLIPMIGVKSAVVCGILPFIITSVMNTLFVFFFTWLCFGKKDA